METGEGAAMRQDLRDSLSTSHNLFARSPLRRSTTAAASSILFLPETQTAAAAAAFVHRLFIPHRRWRFLPHWRPRLLLPMAAALFEPAAAASPPPYAFDSLARASATWTRPALLGWRPQWRSNRVDSALTVERLTSMMMPTYCILVVASMCRLPRGRVRKQPRCVTLEPPHPPFRQCPTTGVEIGSGSPLGKALVSSGGEHLLQPLVSSPSPCNIVDMIRMECLQRHGKLRTHGKEKLQFFPALAIVHAKKKLSPISKRKVTNSFLPYVFSCLNWTIQDLELSYLEDDHAVLCTHTNTTS